MNGMLMFATLSEFASGFLGGLAPSVVAFICWLYKFQKEKSKDRALAPMLGIVPVETEAIKQMFYLDVPDHEPQSDLPDEEKMRLESEIQCRENQKCDTDSQGNERENFIEGVKKMVNDRRSGGVVLVTGPSDTGKETLVWKAVRPFVEKSMSNVDRVAKLIQRVLRPNKYNETREPNVRLYYVKNMMREWVKIKPDISDWIRIEGARMATGNNVCVIYLDFESPLSIEKSSSVVQNVKELHESIRKEWEACNIIFVVKITGQGIDNQDENIVSYTSRKLYADQMMKILEEDKRLKSDQIPSHGRLLELTDGKIGQFVRIWFRGQMSTVTKKAVKPCDICSSWIHNENVSGLNSCQINKCFALVFVLAAIAKRMSVKEVLDVRSFIGLIEKDSCGVPFVTCRNFLQNAFVFSQVDLSMAGKEDFQLDMENFWMSFLAGWGVLDNFDFVDELHQIIRNMAADDKMQDKLMLLALSVSNALLQSISHDSSTDDLGTRIVDKFKNVMRHIDKLHTFSHVFKVGFARTVAAWLWTRIGALEDSTIEASISKVARALSGNALDASILVEFMPVLVPVCESPVKWFGGDLWWNRVDLTNIHSGRTDEQDAETFLLLVSYLSIALSHVNRFLEDVDQMRSLYSFFTKIRKRTLLTGRRDIRALVIAILRVAKRTYRMEEGAYNDKADSDFAYLDSLKSLVVMDEFWRDTRFSHLIPALIRVLELCEFDGPEVDVLEELTSRVKTVFAGLSSVYEQCYLKTSINLLESHSKFYHESVDGMSNGDVVLEEESEILRDDLWIEVDALLKLCEKEFLTDEIEERIHRLLVKALEWQSGMNDRYKAYVFLYLSRLCRYMSSKIKDARLPDNYRFMRKVSDWLLKVDKSSGSKVDVQSRCRVFKGVIPEMFANLHNAFAKTSEWKEKWVSWAEKDPNGGTILTPEMIMDIIFTSHDYVENLPLDMKRIMLMEINSFEHVGTRSKIRRAVEIVFGHLADDVTEDISDEVFYDRFESLLYNRAFDKSSSSVPNKMKMVLRLMADILCRCASTHKDNNENEKAYRVFSMELELRRRLMKKDLSHGGDESIAQTIKGIASLDADMNRLESALERYGEALSIFKNLASKSPSTNDYEVANLLNVIAGLHYCQGDLQKAEAKKIEALDLLRPYYCGKDVKYAPEYAQVLFDLADVHYAQGSLPDAQCECLAKAEAEYAEALQIRRELLEKHATDKSLFYDVITTLFQFAGFLEYRENDIDALAKYNEILNLYDRILDVKRGVHLSVDDRENCDQDIAAVHERLSRIHWRQGQLELASREVDEALEIRRDLVQKDAAKFTFDLANVLREFAKLDSDLKRPGNAKAKYDEALKIMKELSESEDRDRDSLLVDILQDFAWFYMEQDELKKGEWRMREALSILCRLAEKDSAFEFKKARALNEMACIHLNMWRTADAECGCGYWESAESEFCEALDMFNRLLDDSSECNGDIADVARSLVDVACSKANDGRYEESERICEQALEIWRRLGEIDSVFEFDKARTLNEMACIHLDMWRAEDPECGGEYWEVSEREFCEALNIFNRLLDDSGECDGDIADVAWSLGESVRSMVNDRRYEESERLCEQALGIWRRLAEKDSAFEFDVARALNEMACIHLDMWQGDNEECACEYWAYAKRESFEALNIFKQFLANSDACYDDVSSVVKSLEERLVAQVERPISQVNGKQYETIERIYAKVLRIRRCIAKADPDKFSGDLANTLVAIAKMHVDLGESEKALRKALDGYEKALKLWRQIAKKDSGKYEIHVVQTLNDIAAIYAKLEQFENAESIKRTYLENAEKAYLDALEILCGLSNDGVEDKIGAESVTAHYGLADIYSRMPDKAKESERENAVGKAIYRIMSMPEQFSQPEEVIHDGSCGSESDDCMIGFGSMTADAKDTEMR